MAVILSGFTAEVVWVGESDESYWELLAELWASGGGFCIVEHDVVPGPTALASLEACQAEWCAVPYPYLNGMYPGLGCARFRGSLTRRAPLVMEQVATITNSSHGPKHWCTLDAWMQRVIRGQGLAGAHVHNQETAEHLGDQWPSHGCVPRPASV